jgi:hypothetical protein
MIVPSAWPQVMELSGMTPGGLASWLAIPPVDARRRHGFNVYTFVIIDREHEAGSDRFGVPRTAPPPTYSDGAAAAFRATVSFDFPRMTSAMRGI